MQRDLVFILSPEALDLGAKPFELVIYPPSLRSTDLQRDRMSLVFSHETPQKPSGSPLPKPRRFGWTPASPGRSAPSGRSGQ